MGNTCYVVATVTTADWRMTVGFRALLMAVCPRPSPSSAPLSAAQPPILDSPRRPPPSRYRLSRVPFPRGAARRVATTDRPTPAPRRIIYGTHGFSRPDFVWLVP